MAIKFRALLNKSNFWLIGGSECYLRFSIESPWQNQSLKSPTGPHTTKHSGNGSSIQGGFKFEVQR